MQEAVDVVGRSAAEVDAAVQFALGADPQYHVVRTGPATTQFVRTFRPTWATVLGIVGILFVGLGLLFFLVRRTESCTVTVADGPRGTVVTFNGALLPDRYERLRVAIGAGPPAPAVAGPTAPPPGFAPHPGFAGPGPGGPPPPGTGRAGSGLLPPPGPAGAAPLPPPPSVLPPPSTAPVPGAPPPGLGHLPPPPAPAGSPLPPPPAPAEPPPPFPGSPAAPPPVAAAGPDRPGAASSTVLRGSAFPAGPQPQDPAARRFVLQFEDGTRTPIRTGTVVGRDPAARAAPDLTDPVLLPLNDPSMQLSKTHLVLRPGAGVLLVEDVHSTNGTTIVRPSGQRVDLEPGTPITVAPGTTIEFGGRRAEVILDA